MDHSEEVKRAIRTALRSVEAVECKPPKDEACQHISAAINQLRFAVDVLIDLMMRAKAGQN